ncbi:hypothetical protein F8M41_010457 [Gigaspora margarita]|uniref:Uncharacterized protein n=1 Tax=Gigaspora margarita TaxID=4874 RepID=A0A8H3X1Q0_GIGMA|nr:hypothetical protein F8M41_010457 [Gigaspora margarita]
MAIYLAAAAVDDVGGTVGDVEAAAAVDDVGGTFDVEAAAAVDDVGGTFDVEAAAADDDVDDVGLFVAVVVSDVIGVFDLVGVAGFDDMGVGAFDDVGVGAFDDVGVGAFEDTADLMSLRGLLTYNTVLSSSSTLPLFTPVSIARSSVSASAV